MNELTSEQFNAAVAAAISGIEHLYRETDLLIVRLREELADDPEPLTLKRGTLGKSGKEGSKRVVVRYEYGALFEPATDDQDDGEDDEDGGEDDAPDEATAIGGRRKRKRSPHEIVASQPLLAVRIAMYDPHKLASFEPQVQFAVMSDWALGNSPAGPDERYRLQSYMLRRVSRALADRVGVSKGLRIRTTAAARRSTGPQKGEDRKLSCSLPAGVEAVPLYSMDSAEALETLAKRMKEMWTSVIGA
jgi:hypothetical protein